MIVILFIDGGCHYRIGRESVVLIDVGSLQLQYRLCKVPAGVAQHHMFIRDCDNAAQSKSNGVYRLIAACGENTRLARNLSWLALTTRNIQKNLTNSPKLRTYFTSSTCVPVCRSQPYPGTSASLPFSIGQAKRSVRRARVFNLVKVCARRIAHLLIRLAPHQRRRQCG